MRSIRAIAAVFILAIAAQFANARTDPYKPVPYVKLIHPEWSRNAVIYELNTRQFTPEGTIRAAEKQLPRLQGLGIDIVWVMPVQPIGEKNRKGKLGSPYAVQDYLKVNPDLGTMEDFKHFVRTAHDLRMHVILDWVANHTAWDNVLVKEHPEWYAKDWKGDFMTTPWEDWGDIIDLDYNQEGLRRYMTDAMKYWVRASDIDGFRCDVAGYVPLDFWNNARKELDAIKPVFMLAEWETRDLHAEAFDMTYAWTWYDEVSKIARGEAGDLGGLTHYYSLNQKAWPPNIMRMLFTSNHDKNSWDGTAFEQFGAGLHAAMVLSFVSDGLPLIYNGQEAGNRKRLKFFERDPIEWHEDPNGELYKKLIALKHQHSALWNAHWGAPMVQIVNSAPQKVFSFVRQNEHDKVLAVINFSPQPQRVTLKTGLASGEYLDYFGGKEMKVDGTTELALPPWGYLVLTKR